MTLIVKVTFENGYASSESPNEFIKRLFKRLEPDLVVIKMSVRQE